jgi:hypothetical protein
MSAGTSTSRTDQQGSGDGRSAVDLGRIRHRHRSYGRVIELADGAPGISRRIVRATPRPHTARLGENAGSSCERRTVDSLLDYHDCPVCGFGQFLEVPGDERPSDEDGDSCEDGVSSARGPDRVCVACGTAMFIDPMLIWPAHQSRTDQAETA